MRNAELEHFRNQKLTESIISTYGNLDVEDLENREIEAKHEVVTEMLEVTAIIGREVELQHLFDTKIFSSVEFPPEIIGLLNIEDVFLLTISKRKRGWKVIFMSPPYESAAWCCDDSNVEPTNPTFEVSRLHLVRGECQQENRETKDKLN